VLVFLPFSILRSALRVRATLTGANLSAVDFNFPVRRLLIVLGVHRDKGLFPKHLTRTGVFRIVAQSKCPVLIVRRLARTATKSPDSAELLSRSSVRPHPFCSSELICDIIPHRTANVRAV
jgi:hypothetical protein